MTMAILANCRCTFTKRRIWWIKKIAVVYSVLTESSSQSVSHVCLCPYGKLKRVVSQVKVYSIAIDKFDRY